LTNNIYKNAKILQNKQSKHINQKCKKMIRLYRFGVILIVERVINKLIKVGTELMADPIVQINVLKLLMVQVEVTSNLIYLIIAD